MTHTRLLALALAGFSLVPFSRADNPDDFFANSVVSYSSGTGFTSGYVDPETALGAPSIQTVDPNPVFGGTFPVDPFSPPYLTNQLVSVGEGGWLTVQFNSPIPNHPDNPFGIDFMIFGNAGFIITNGDFTGGGITDGSLFGANAGSTRVWVSADNVTYFPLDLSLAPAVDAYFPTDGSGNPHLPLDPSLTGGDFAGLDLAGIRSLYGGSSGGAGFDLDWARDALNQPVLLSSVSFVRVEVLSGASEIDAFSVVPEPFSSALFGTGTLILGLASCRSRKRPS